MKCKRFERKIKTKIGSFTHTYTRHTCHTENESIGTTSYLKCHFSENSINPKQVQTPMFIFTFIQCAIYLLPSSSLLVFEPVFKKINHPCSFHIDTTTSTSVVSSKCQNNIVHLRRKCVFSVRCWLHFGTYINGCQWNIDDKSAFKLIKILPTNLPLWKTFAPKMNENIILFARHY